MPDLAKAKSYRTACLDYQTRIIKHELVHDPQVARQLEELRQKWSTHTQGFQFQGYQPTYAWLLPQFTPEGIAPLWYEILLEGYSASQSKFKVLNIAILNITEGFNTFTLYVD